ncbi:MAG: PilZ domain-containing protein [Motiliproteus sp.]
MSLPTATIGYSLRGPELRRSQRYQTKLQAEVVNCLQQHASATVTDISNQGLRLEGTQQLIAVLFPRPLSSSALSTAIPVDNSFRLKLVLPQPSFPDADASVELQCRSVYVLRVKRDWYRVGICYQEIEIKEGARLEAFILSLQR